MQSNLNHCRDAQELLWQFAEEEEIDIAVISEPYIKAGSVTWIMDKSGLAAIGLFRNSLKVCQIESESSWRQL